MTANTQLPDDAHRAHLIGRVWNPLLPGGGGPVLVLVTGGQVWDASPVATTCADLLAQADPVGDLQRALADGRLAGLGDAQALLDASDAHHQHLRAPATPPSAQHASAGGFAPGLSGPTPASSPDASAWLLAPCDLQAIKAAGVTFVASMLERVIEEQARGDASRAHAVRSSITAVIGDNLRAVKPGSPQALALKAVLVEQGLWSQYLEVGIGVDAEIFTKSQPLSAVGSGQWVGLHPVSAWNNPEPEVVLAVSPSGQVRGAALGNDVNLRDIEGRSALLLGKAKDNNASCAIGPFIRLFDSHFDIDDVRRAELALHVSGQDGFEMQGSSSLALISRDPLELVNHAIGAPEQRTHQYPDGFMLFLGTMFAPTQDRHGAGSGFTHALGDLVRVSTPRLGSLCNRVTTSDLAPPWTFGFRDLMRSLGLRLGEMRTS